MGPQFNTKQGDLVNETVITGQYYVQCAMQLTNVTYHAAAIQSNRNTCWIK